MPISSRYNLAEIKKVDLTALGEYLTAFVTTRKDMNQQVMTQRVAAQKSRQRDYIRQMEILRRNIGSLATEKAKLVRGEIEGKWDVAAGLARGMFSAEAARLRGMGDIQVAEIEGLYRYMGQVLVNNSKIVAELQLDRAGLNVVEEELLRRITNQPPDKQAALTNELISRMIAQHGAAEESRYGWALAAHFYNTLNNSTDAGGHGMPDLAEAVKNRFFDGRDPMGVMEEIGIVDSTAAMSDIQDQMRRYGLSVDYDTVNQKSLEIVGLGGSISGGATISKSTEDALSIIDTQLTDAQSELDALKKAQAEDLASYQESGGFVPAGANWVVGSPFRRLHREQKTIDDLAATVAREREADPAMFQERQMTLGEFADERGGAYRNAPGRYMDWYDQQSIDVRAGDQAPDRRQFHADAAPSSGGGVYTWIASTLQAAATTMETNPKEAWMMLGNVQSMIDQLPEEFRALTDMDGAMAEIWAAAEAVDTVGDFDVAVVQAAADRAISQAQGRELDFSELLAIRLDNAGAQPDAEDRFAAYQEVSDWAKSLPADLTGEWASVVESALTESGSTPEMMEKSLKDLSAYGFEVAKEEREYQTTESAEEALFHQRLEREEKEEAQRQKDEAALASAEAVAADPNVSDEERATAIRDANTRRTQLGLPRKVYVTPADKEINRLERERIVEQLDLIDAELNSDPKREAGTGVYDDVLIGGRTEEEVARRDALIRTRSILNEQLAELDRDPNAPKDEVVPFAQGIELGDAGAAAYTPVRDATAAARQRAAPPTLESVGAETSAAPYRAHGTTGQELRGGRAEAKPEAYVEPTPEEMQAHQTQKDLEALVDEEAAIAGMQTRLGETDIALEKHAPEYEKALTPPPSQTSSVQVGTPAGSWDAEMQAALTQTGEYYDGLTPGEVFAVTAYAQGLSQAANEFDLNAGLEKLAAYGGLGDVDLTGRYLEAFRARPEALLEAELGLPYDMVAKYVTENPPQDSEFGSALSDLVYSKYYTPADTVEGDRADRQELASIAAFADGDLEALTWDQQTQLVELINQSQDEITLPLYGTKVPGALAEHLRSIDPDRVEVESFAGTDEGASRAAGRAEQGRLETQETRLKVGLMSAGEVDEELAAALAPKPAAAPKRRRAPAPKAAPKAAPEPITPPTHEKGATPDEVWLSEYKAAMGRNKTVAPGSTDQKILKAYLKDLQEWKQKPAPKAPIRAPESFVPTKLRPPTYEQFHKNWMREVQAQMKLLPDAAYGGRRRPGAEKRLEELGIDVASLPSEAYGRPTPGAPTEEDDLDVLTAGMP